MFQDRPDWSILPANLPNSIPVIVIDRDGNLRSNPPTPGAVACVMVLKKEDIASTTEAVKQWALACRYILGLMQQITPTGPWEPNTQIAHQILVNILPQITIKGISLPVLDFKELVGSIGKDTPIFNALNIQIKNAATNSEGILHDFIEKFKSVLTIIGSELLNTII